MSCQLDRKYCCWFWWDFFVVVVPFPRLGIKCYIAVLHKVVCCVVLEVGLRAAGSVCGRFLLPAI